LKSLLLSLLTALLLCSHPAVAVQLEGKNFHTDANITWAVTNPLPSEVSIYKLTGRSVSSAAISNAMAMGSFRPLDKHRSDDKRVLSFQDKKDDHLATRRLNIDVINGTIQYSDSRADSFPIHDVPSFNEAEKIALEYLERLGGNTNQIIPKPWPRTQTKTTSFDKKGGQPVVEDISMRGIFLFRQIDGIQLPGQYFLINLSNNAKPSMFDMNWPHLEPTRKYKFATPKQIIDLIQNGKAVFPENSATEIDSKHLTITKLTVCYQNGKNGDGETIFDPFGRIEVSAESNTTNTTVFELSCPISLDP
jgi:hypothetical protein